ncbi:primosomal replication protein N [Advenella sp. WQ 585]|uniref:Replication restart protein PriB n=1 Tax=Advenella mandrilli TaxID=2800330 RepID=A0ABS1EDS0_9BURK|nr:primosomal replication protein N [Advenella mandrilli]MBK1779862.1 primosomal replication protein N [Advenella mandrilli]
MNQTQLQARILEVKPLRHTPAGLPALDLVLEHQSEIIEASHPRMIDFIIHARALGETAMVLSKVAMGSEIRVKGFLAQARKNSGRVILHIQNVQFPSKGVARVHATV